MLFEKLLLVLSWTMSSADIGPIVAPFREMDSFLSTAVRVLSNRGYGAFKTPRYEFVGVVWDYSRKENAFYIDFLDNNGWLVVSNSLQIRGWADKGDVKEIRTIGDPVIFLDGKFGVFDNDEGFLFFNGQEREFANIDQKGGDLSVSSNPIGYDSILSYLQTKYDSVFTLGDNCRLSSLTSAPTTSWYTQYPESVFHRWDDQAQKYFSEGNCGPTAVANVLQYYSRFDGKNSLASYTSTTSFSPYSNNSLIQAAWVQGYSPKSAYVTIHELYSKVRDYTISQGYVCGPSYSSWLQYAYQSSCAYYGYSGAMASASASTSADVEDSIDNNVPVIVWMGNDMAYEDHFATGLSYRRYWTEKQLENNIYVYFDVFCIGIIDGHFPSERWYDVDRWCSYDMGDYRCTGIAIYSLSIGGNS
ncbi:MAG: hypothetical protein E7179_01585 [Erysipelotrichaceae bacterium]|jgi:hypothetical protein|nr:hypothetical protein [Erysipelotrichaceae bacterium]